MNSLETEYSFLAPTWKLPSIGTTSMYPGRSHSPSPSTLVPDASTWNNTMYNSRYIPPNANHRTHPSNDNHDSNNMPIQSRHNGHSDNRGLPPPTQKRVQIVDHNRQTPSIMSEGESQNSYSPPIQQKSKPYRDQIDDNKSDSAHTSAQRINNFNVHEYLYGLRAPDPGSYVSAYKNQQRRLQDDRVNRKPVLTEYKTFVQNGGFGPVFGNADYRTYAEKLDTEKKRKSYSKIVRANNQYKVEEHKRIQNNGGQQRNRIHAVHIPRQRRPDEMRSHFLSAQEAGGYEDYIEIPHYFRSRSRSAISPRLSNISPTPRRFSNSPALRQDSFDNLHPWNQTDVLSGELYVDRSSSRTPTPRTRRVRFHSRDFIRRRSSTFIDFPRKNGCLSAHFSTRKSIAKLLEEKDQLAFKKFKDHSSFLSNIKEKKFIIPHSMMNNNMQSSPTARLKNIKQPYRSQNRIMATTSTNNTKKPILIIKSPENSVKTSSRNVRFGPEIIADDKQVTTPPIQNSQSSSTTTKIKPNHQHKNKKSTDN